MSKKPKYARVHRLPEGLQDWKARIRNQYKLFPEKRRKEKQANHYILSDMNKLAEPKTPKAISP
jgi:hypothetical protein